MGFPDGFNMGYKRKSQDDAEVSALRILSLKKTQVLSSVDKEAKRSVDAGINLHMRSVQRPRHSSPGCPSLLTAPPPAKAQWIFIPSAHPPPLHPADPEQEPPGLKGYHASLDSVFLLFDGGMCPRLPSSSFQKRSQSWSWANVPFMLLERLIQFPSNFPLYGQNGLNTNFMD